MIHMYFPLNMIRQPKLIGHEVTNWSPRRAAQASVAKEVWLCIFGSPLADEYQALVTTGT